MGVHMQILVDPMERAIEDAQTMTIETRDTVQKLHTLLRPYLLRRLKSEVEKQLPKKFEHLVYCRLSKRQRFLYDEFMSRAATKETLASGNFLSIVNCLMQLRKVCNHPDLFEVRPIVTSFAMSRSAVADFEIKELLVRKRLLAQDVMEEVDLRSMGLQFIDDQETSLLAARSTRRLDSSSKLPHIMEIPGEPPPIDTRTIAGFKARRNYDKQVANISKWRQVASINRIRCKRVPIFGCELLRTVQKMHRPLLPWIVEEQDRCRHLDRVDVVPQMIKSYQQRLESLDDTINTFATITPKVVARDITDYSFRSPLLSSLSLDTQFDTLHQPAVKLQIAFPEPALLQYDCGKLQELDTLLRARKAGGHRVLIFTQMTKVLDILEIFLNFHGYRYLRLDGATKIEQRQIITERFNVDSRIFAFIASSRSGGVGIK